MIRTFDEITKEREKVVESISLLIAESAEIQDIVANLRQEVKTKTDEYKERFYNLNAIRHRLAVLYGIKQTLDYLMNYDSRLDTGANYIIKTSSNTAIRKDLTKD